MIVTVTECRCMKQSLLRDLQHSIPPRIYQPINNCIRFAVSIPRSLETHRFVSSKLQQYASNMYFENCYRSQCCYWDSRLVVFYRYNNYLLHWLHLQPMANSQRLINLTAIFQEKKA